MYCVNHVFVYPIQSYSLAIKSASVSCSLAQAGAGIPIFSSLKNIYALSLLCWFVPIFVWFMRDYACASSNSFNEFAFRWRGLYSASSPRAGARGHGPAKSPRARRSRALRWPASHSYAHRSTACAAAQDTMYLGLICQYTILIVLLCMLAFL